jgi:hypothetical protein
MLAWPILGSDAMSRRSSMSYPIRFVACTCNLWRDQRWPERREPLTRFFERHCPDIACVQELHPATRDVLDTVLPVRMDE